MTLPRLRLRIEPPGAASFSGEYDGPSVVLGRSAQVTVPLADASLSRQHARFFEQGGAWFVEDLGSKNATLLNGRVLTAPTRVASGDTVRMAGTRIEIDLGGEAPEAPPEDEPLTGLFQPASAILDRRDQAAPRSLKLLNEVHRALARPITQEALAELILDSAFTHLQPEEGVLFLRRPNGELYRARSRRLEGTEGEFVYSRRLIHEVADGGQAALVEDVSHDDRFKSSESLLGFGVRSLVAAPLLDASGSAGMIVLHSRAQLRHFDEQDLELLVSLASAATLRLRSLVAADESARRQVLDKELALAHDIQMGMIPTRFPDHPEFQLAAALRPARSVGGDLYDFILEGRRLWFLVGDVSGKGVGAALFMAVTRTLFRAVAPGAASLRGVAERMNDELARDNERAMFVTAFLACLDLDSGRLEYVNAGHNLPYRLQGARAPEAITGGRGLPFGVFEAQAYPTDSLLLGMGDGLFVFTDGVVEATDAAEEAFGEARLESGLLGLAGAPSAHIVERTLAGLDAFVGQAPAADDITLLALRYSRRS